MGAITMGYLPKIGYVAYLGSQPVAAGFLRRVEGGLAQMDTLVSSSHFGSQVRHEGIKRVVDSLIEEARELNLLGIIAMSDDEGILSRAELVGFQKTGQTTIMLSLYTFK